MKTSEFYPISDRPTVQEMKQLGLDTSFNSRYGHRNVYAEYIGEKREPKKGEWYLSGAIATAYRAPNNLSTIFHIARLIRVKKQINWTKY